MYYLPSSLIITAVARIFHAYSYSLQLAISIGKTLGAGPLPVQREKKPVDSLLGTVLNFFNAPARPKSSNLGTMLSATANPGTQSAAASVNSAVLVASPLPPPPAPVEPVVVTNKESHGTW